MSLFHKQITRYVDANGKQVNKSTPGAAKVRESSKLWSARYRDADGIRREVCLDTTNKVAAQAILSERLKHVANEKAGLVSPFEMHAKQPLTKHLTDFAVDLRNRDRTENHVAPTEARIGRIVAECKFRFIGDISASAVTEFLAKLRRDGTSTATTNHYLRAMKGFTRWLVRDKRSGEDRLQHLSMMNAKADQRIERRELTDDELRCLLEATRSGRECACLTGEKRFMLYAVAVGTGLRASELASLTPRSFVLTSETPTVSIEVAHEKARRHATDPCGLGGHAATVVNEHSRRVANLAWTVGRTPTRLGDDAARLGQSTLRLD